MTLKFSAVKGKRIRADGYKWHVKTAKAKAKLFLYKRQNINIVRKRYKFLLLRTIILYSPTNVTDVIY